MTAFLHALQDLPEIGVSAGMTVMVTGDEETWAVDNRFSGRFLISETQGGLDLKVRGQRAGDNSVFGQMNKAYEPVRHTFAKNEDDAL
jgi:hypothetical protein